MSVLWDTEILDATEPKLSDDFAGGSIAGAAVFATSTFGVGTCTPVTSLIEGFGQVGYWTRFSLPRAYRAWALSSPCTVGLEGTASVIVAAEPAHSVLDTESQVRLIHERSGLTWEQLGRLFGVSRRAVHNWAAGSRLSGRNAEVLARVVAMLVPRANYSPEENRDWLLASRAGGISLFDEIRTSSKRGTPVTDVLPIRERLGID